MPQKTTKMDDAGVIAIQKAILKVCKTGKKGTKSDLDMTYETGYNVIERWCRKQNGKWNEDNCILLAHMAYAWMPRSLRLYTNGIGIGNHAETVAAEINRAVKAKGVYQQDMVEHVQKFIDHSFIGASKFLHFIFPDTYAMWDKNVIKAINSCLSGKKLTVSAKNFILYQQAMQRALPEYKKTKKDGSLRDIENQLFLVGKNIQ